MIEDFVIMGRIGGPFGIKGWLKLQVFSEEIDTLGKYKNWYLSNDEKNWKLIKVEQYKISTNKVSVKFYDVGDRTTSDPYKGYLVGVPRDSLPKLKENEYYWNDLIGYKVINLQDILLGKVDTFLETGANDVLVVEGSKQRLIPYTPSTIIKIDKKQQKIAVDWDENF
jgi:16S rRNA processing protein RimM|tara:strand:+ start:76 stop:579 length:504 start_codon:yes stop_codon:yes gene_type:complete